MANEQTNESEDRYFNSEAFKRYEAEHHITRFYHKRSDIAGFNRKYDIAISKDGDQYCAMVGNCLADALYVGFGSTELKALTTLIEDRALKLRTSKDVIPNGSVYCCGIFD